MRFVAIDVETANADHSSICSIGAVEFIDLAPARELYSLVDPADEFDAFRISIHGIDEDAVRGAPRFENIFPRLSDLVGDGIVVSHTPYDRTAIHRAIEKSHQPAWGVRWLDSARVVRRAWPERFASSGYGLAPVAEFLGIEFNHHHALEDARTSGLILCRAIRESGHDLIDWTVRASQPIFGGASSSKRIAQKGTTDGPFSGETIVFTGALHIPRREAAEMAARVGFDVAPNVTKKTTLLVVGDQDARKLGGQDKSSKHRKAETLIGKGLRIRIVTETDFSHLVAAAGPEPS